MVFYHWLEYKSSRTQRLLVNPPTCKHRLPMVVSIFLLSPLTMMGYCLQKRKKLLLHYSKLSWTNDSHFSLCAEFKSRFSRVLRYLIKCLFKRLSITVYLSILTIISDMFFRDYKPVNSFFLRGTPTSKNSHNRSFYYLHNKILLDHILSCSIEIWKVEKITHLKLTGQNQQSHF